MPSAEQQEPFDPSHIVVLPALEVARRQPAMYLDSLDKAGLHKLLGYAIGGILSHYHALKRPLGAITIRLNTDESVTVESCGPQVDDRTLEASEDRLRWEVEQMGCPGSIALCVVNSLSSRLDVGLRVPGRRWCHFSYRDRILCDDGVDSTIPNAADIVLTFWPDAAILPITQFDYALACASIPSFRHEFDFVTSLERSWSGADVALAVPIEVVDVRRRSG